MEEAMSEEIKVINGEDIASVDKNFYVDRSLKYPLVWYDVKCAPLDLYGIMRSADNSTYVRLPESIAERVNDGVQSLNYNTSGARVRFSTDSPYIALRCVYKKMSKFPHMPATGVSGFDLYLDTDYDSVYYRTFIPDIKNGETGYVCSGELTQREGMNSYTVNFPLYNRMDEVYIGIAPDAVMDHGKRYTIEKPIVFYGNSVTQGGCASRPGNAYTAMVARWLDADHINLGFSGSGKSEPDMIDYIASLDMSFFVYDYDHNAGSVDYLKSSHERGFKQFREKQPDTPVIMLSMPNWEWKNQTYCFDGGTVPFGYAKYRRDVIYNTYSNAIKAGDERVMFVDGRSYFAGRNRYDCTVDGSHPNDLGMYKMAESVADAIELFLRKLK
ncbi:MAG: hypothetical protein E7646_06590 [Ruminococcaceae bacterium]|nr:hypothetical protein [Oscillospiraceae bacterium]